MSRQSGNIGEREGNRRQSHTQWSKSGWVYAHPAIGSSKLGSLSPAFLTAVEPLQSSDAAPAIELSLAATADKQCAQIGCKLTTNGESAIVRAAIKGIPFGTITIHTESGPIHTESLSNTGTGGGAFVAAVGSAASFRLCSMTLPDARSP